jgi:ribosomal-protein-alanine N-acetyltransferase
MIRPAVPGDCDVVAALHAASFSEAWTASTFAGLLAEPAVFGYLAEDRGFVLLRVASDEAEILTLAVLPAARRQGVAMSLIMAGAHTATLRGARTMFLEVAESNHAARGLYQRLGFDASGRRKGYYGAGQDALSLKACLPLGNCSHLH